MRNLCEPPPTFNRQLLIWSPMFDFFWLHQRPDTTEPVISQWRKQGEAAWLHFLTHNSTLPHCKFDQPVTSHQTERWYKYFSVSARGLWTSLESRVVPGEETREYVVQSRVWCCYLFVPASQYTAHCTALLYTHISLPPSIIPRHPHLAIPPQTPPPRPSVTSLCKYVMWQISTASGLHV